MADLSRILQEISEHVIAEKVHRPFDDAKIQFRVSRSIDTYEGFCEVLSEFYEHMFKCCIGRGGLKSREQALGRARELLEQELRRKGLDFTAAFLEARAGLNQGLDGHLTAIKERMKLQETEHYITAVFDRHFPPPASASFAEKVEVVRQLAKMCGPSLGPDFDPNMPEVWAGRIVELVRRYSAALQSVAATARRGD